MTQIKLTSEQANDLLTVYYDALEFAGALMDVADSKQNRAEYLNHSHGWLTGKFRSDVEIVPCMRDCLEAKKVGSNTVNQTRSSGGHGHHIDIQNKSPDEAIHHMFFAQATSYGGSYMEAMIKYFEQNIKFIKTEHHDKIELLKQMNTQLIIMQAKQWDVEMTKAATVYCSDPFILHDFSGDNYVTRIERDDSEGCYVVRGTNSDVFGYKPRLIRVFDDGHLEGFHGSELGVVESQMKNNLDAIFKHFYHKSGLEQDNGLSVSIPSKPSAPQLSLTKCGFFPVVMATAGLVVAATVAVSHIKGMGNGGDGS